MPWILDEPGQHVPVLVWARALDQGTERQLVNLARQPWVRRHVAAMPDAHVAYGVAVGTVFATDDTLVPGALGGDLGCGVCAVPLDLDGSRLDRRTLERVHGVLERAVPTGSRLHARDAPPLPEPLASAPLSTGHLEHMRAHVAPRHLGTLGGGNHFLELDRGGDGSVWLLVHSGSRGPGGAIAEHHVAAAGGPTGTLPADDERGRAYLGDVAWALDFARQNRAAICARSLEALAGVIAVTAGDPVDIHHNYVAREEHGGEPLLVHRKGATAARAGATGIVPGSMGTATYLVRGRGNDASFSSCAHGAGRVMSRAEARERIRRRAFEAQMRGVVHDERRASQLVEEAPGAYRDIVEVMEDQADLVEPLLRLEPLVVVKG